jgi:predicted MPP superfamily phosphohydrolase
MPVWGEGHHRWRYALEAAEPCAHALRGIQAHHGSVAVMGNHDDSSDPDYVSEKLQNVGIRVLRNQSFPIERGGKKLWIAGINDVIGNDNDLDATLHGIGKNEATVLLCHEPDYADHAARFPVDLQLSGHSHGGQIRLPFVGAAVLPPMAKKYPWGLYQVGPLTLYTNAGVGTIRLPMRWNCPPEVTLVTLRATV